MMEDILAASQKHPPVRQRGGTKINQLGPRHHLGQDGGRFSDKLAETDLWP